MATINRPRRQRSQQSPVFPAAPLFSSQLDTRDLAQRRAAYGWEDLDLGHDFYGVPQGLRFTISESDRREVLGRLLALNHARYEAGVKEGPREERKKKGRRGAGEWSAVSLSAGGRPRGQGWRMTGPSGWSFLRSKRI